MYTMWFYPTLFLICCSSQIQKKKASQNFIIDGYEEILGLI